MLRLISPGRLYGRARNFGAGRGFIYVAVCLAGRGVLMSVRHSKAAQQSDNIVRLAAAATGFGEQEALNAAILNALPVAVYVTDAQGRITFFNEAAVKLAGRRPTLGVDEWCVTWKLFWPDGTPLPHNRCPMALALTAGEEARGVEAVAERPDGTRITFMPFPTLLRDAAGAITGAVNVLIDITESKRAEARQRLLTNEVNHRANNLLAVVQAMVRLTTGKDVDGFRGALNGRLEALGHAHSLLAKSRWVAADLQHLVAEELAPYMGDRARAWVSGTILPMKPAAAQSMALILHELATNAAKYGALSTSAGRVMVEWRTGRNELVFQWCEEGGPGCAAPTSRGVGSTVIERAVAQLGAQSAYEWLPSGMRFEMSAPKQAIAAEPLAEQFQPA